MLFCIMLGSLFIISFYFILFYHLRSNFCNVITRIPVSISIQIIYTNDIYDDNILLI